MDDLISRQAAIDEAKRLHDVAWTNWKETRISANTMIDALEQLPSAERDYKFDEWCTECKEYDQERHCCPRFNHVIRTTLQEVQAEVVRCKDCKRYDSHDHRCKVVESRY